MNARQKAKYYKRKYEELASKPMPICTVTERKFDILTYSKVVPKEQYIEGDDDYAVVKHVLGDVIDGVVETAKNYVDIRREEDPTTNTVKFVGRLMVGRTC